MRVLQNNYNKTQLNFISLIHFLMVQQLHQSIAMITSQNKDTMSKPGRKGR